MEIEITHDSVLLKTIRHLANQKIPAETELYSCRYLTDDGLKCAIGCHIPANEYNPKMEFKSVNVLDHEKLLPPSLKSIIDATSSDFLLDLQKLHDGNISHRIGESPKFNKDNMIDRLDVIRIDYDISENIYQLCIDLIEGM